MTKNKKGFTIIEVVLVLAIAGLIFLMVFIALPALQRSQRNSRRRQDMARILSAFNDYQANNNGRMPDGDNDLNKLIQNYIGASKQTKAGIRTDTGTGCDGDQFCDPDGSLYILTQHVFGASYGVATECRYDGNGCGKGGGAQKENSMTHVIHYWPKAKCGEDEEKMANTNAANNIAIAYYLEGGAVYCGDNQ